MLDTSDYYFFLLTGLDRVEYDRADKVCDAAFYMCAILYFVCLRKRVWYWSVLVIAYSYRLLGNAIFIITYNPHINIMFPNVGDWLLLMYALADFGFPARKIVGIRWLHQHLYIHILLIFLCTIGKIAAEVYVWGGGNHSLDTPPCHSPSSCWRILSIPYSAFIIMAVMSTAFKHLHYHDDATPCERVRLLPA